MAKKKRPQRRKAGQQRIHKKAAEALAEQRKAFKRKFGRDPGPGDPVLFDPDADKPEPFDPDKLTAMMVISHGGALLFGGAWGFGDVDSASPLGVARSGGAFLSVRGLTQINAVRRRSPLISRIRKGAGDDRKP